MKMLWVIIFGVVFFLVLLFGVVFDINDFRDAVSAYVLMFATCACMLGLVFSGICSYICPTEEVLTDTCEIVALKDSSSVSGRLFLGVGLVGEEMSYQYFEKTADGVKACSISADDVTIIEMDDGSTPRIETYSEKPVGAWKYWTFPIVDREIYIFVPVGSVTSEFVVDLD